MAFVLDDMVFWPSINDLSEGAALDLVAVLGGVELLHHLVVLLWHE